MALTATLPSASALPPKMPAVELQFVTISHPDDIKKRNTRRAISQHVMKEIGMARRHKGKGVRSKKSSAEAPSRNINDDIDKRVATYAAGLRDPEPAPRRRSEDGLSKSVAPYGDQARDLFNLSPKAILSRPFSARAELLRNYLLRPDSPMCTRMRELCFTIAMFDDSAFYIMLSEAAIWDVGRCQRPLLEENPLSVNYYTAALRSVSGQIQALRSAVCYGIISTVIGIASYDVGVRNHTRWATHMCGLKSLVDACGGIDNLGSEHVKNGVLWTDMVGSVATDSQPGFQLPRSMTSGVSKHTPFTVLQETTATLRARSPDLSAACRSLEMLSEVAELAVGNPLSKWVQDQELINMFARACHSVLFLPRCSIAEAELHPSPDLAMHEAIRLAALLFIVGPLTTMAGDHEFELKHLGQLPNLLRTVPIAWDGVEALEMWVLVHGALAERGEDKEWMVARVFESMRARGLGWQEMFREVVGIAWVDAAFAEKLGRLEEEWRRHVGGES